LLRSATAKSSEAKNIALSGGFGVGKSSILKEFIRSYRGNAVAISLLALRPRKGESASVCSNRIQKEIVKQLLYREPPVRVPASRYRRASRFRFWRSAGWSALLAASVAGTLVATGYATDSEVLRDASTTVLSAQVGAFVLCFSAASTLVAWAVHGRLHIDKISASAVSVSLGSREQSYFDAYLDELVYFFESTKCNLVVFEDIDRFKGHEVLLALRELNLLLNNSKQVRKKPVRFVYATRDSIFDVKNAPPTTDARDVDAHFREISSARVKFFDLVIPVVPFLSHLNVRSRLSNELARHGFTFNPLLLDLIAAQFVDMRLVKDLSNEFQVVNGRLGGVAGGDRGVDAVLAMVAFKNVYPKDFERIGIAESALDLVYREYRNTINARGQEIDRDLAAVRSRGAIDEFIESRARVLGQGLIDYLDRLRRHLPGFALRGSFVVGGKAFETDGVTTREFWEQLSRPDAGPVTVKITAPVPATIALSREDLEAALGESVLFDDVEAEARGDQAERLRTLESQKAFWLNPTLAEVIASTECGLSGFARERLPGEFAFKLVESGFISKRFTLFSSEYHGDISDNVLTFLIQNVERREPDVHYPFADDEIAQLIGEAGEAFLRGPSVRNLRVFDYLLDPLRASSDDTGLALRSLDMNDDLVIEFVAEYLDVGLYRETIVKVLAGTWDCVFDFVVSRERLDVPTRARFVAAGLAGSREGVPYTSSSGVVDFVRTRLVEIDVLADDSLSQGDANRIVATLRALGVSAPDLEKVSSQVRAALIANSAFDVTAANVRTALGIKGDASIDAIRNAVPDIYLHVLGNLSEYLDSIDRTSPTFHTVEAESAFSDVINDLVERNPNFLPRVIADASDACVLDDIRTVPSAAWRALAVSRRFAPSFANVEAYVGEVGSIDEDLAGLLERYERVDAVEGVPEHARLDLALKVANCTKIKAAARAKIIGSLGLNEQLPLSLLDPPTGGIWGALVRAGVIPDEAATYAVIARGDARERIAYIQGSDKFSSYLDLADWPFKDLVVNEETPPEVLGKLAQRIGDFAPLGDLQILEPLARVALANATPVGSEALCDLAEAGVHVEVILPLLARGVGQMPGPELAQVLEALGAPYARLVSRRKGYVQVPRSPATEALGSRLASLGYVGVRLATEDGSAVRMYLRKATRAKDVEVASAAAPADSTTTPGA
jgi:hypothetical protein